MKLTSPALRRLRRRLALALVATALGGCGSEARPVDPLIVPPPPPPPPPALPSGVHALTGIQTTLGHGDLAPLREIVGGARFVALGESTHTSHGYYQAKHRLIRFLVEEMGFRVVALETPWLEALPAAEYVATCRGTPEAALGALNGVWRDASVRDLLRWMCDRNRANPADPVTFYGFDVQEPWTTTPKLLEFVRTAAPGETARVEPLRACLGATAAGLTEFYLSAEYREHAAGRPNAAAHEQCMGGISAMESWITSERGALEAATSAKSVEEARLMLVALRAWEEQLWIPDPGGYQARDHGMSELLLRLHRLHAPGTRAVVWAWNWHIARRYEEVRGFNDDPDRREPRQGARAMGSFLHASLGSDYVPIALIGYRVEMVEGSTNPPLPTHPLAVERRLNELQREVLLVDLRQPVGDTLVVSGREYQVSQEWGDPYRQFDALLFLQRSGPMQMVATSGP